jgi:hypothetical protein
MTSLRYDHVVLPSAAAVNCGGTERGRAETLLAAVAFIGARSKANDIFSF